MMNTAYTQLSQNGLPRRYSTANGQRTLRSGSQDSPATPTAPLGTPHAAPSKNAQRPVEKDPQTIRIQRENLSLKKVRADLWVEPLVKEELLRVAKANGLNLSQTGNALLKRMLTHNLYEQHQGIFQTATKEAIHEELATVYKRLSFITFLLVRIAFSSEQGRCLVTNLLNYQTTITPEKLTAILSGSSKAAKAKITEKTPQLQTIMEELEKLFLAEGVVK